MLDIIVGVPVICPVDVLNSNPFGNDGLIKKFSGGTPPVTVIGVNAVLAIFCVSVVDGTDCVVLSPAPPVPTISVKLLLATCPPASVKVTT